MTTQKKIFNGVWTAMVTPFREDGTIDTESFKACLQQQKAAGITGVVIAGSTGEGATLSVSEKVSLVRLACAEVGADMRVMANVGGSSTDQSVELAKLATDAGADSLLVVTPPYNKPTTAGLLCHFRKIAEATPLPLCLYHVPSRTGQRLSVAQMQAICDIPSVQVVKEASGDMVFFSAAKRACAAEFLSGDDPTYLASLAVGGIGLISVAANTIPESFVAMTQEFTGGEVQKALAQHEHLMPCIEALACETNPGPIKAAMAHKKQCLNTLRLPLVPVSPENFQFISKIFS